MGTFFQGDTIAFVKMTGSGNDFILVDNRDGCVRTEMVSVFASRACRRRLSTGADGLILIERDAEVDFAWRFFNADGSEAEMCGNGSRCAARFAFLQGIVSRSTMTFRTKAGLIKAELTGAQQVKVQIPSARDLTLSLSLPLPRGILPPCRPRDAHLPRGTEPARMEAHFINTGVPHTVVICAERSTLEDLDVPTFGRLIRFHEHFTPRGTNVNFLWVAHEHELFIRTYERGVEDETLACGTGAIAGALISAALGMTHSPVSVHTRGGEVLRVFFEKTSEGFFDIFLEGQALVVYEGLMWRETLDMGF